MASMLLRLMPSDHWRWTSGDGALVLLEEAHVGGRFLAP